MRHHQTTLATADRSSDNGEFIATQPCDDVSGAYRANQTPRELDQQRVAGSMSQCIVDRLEVVEVDQQCSNTFHGGS